ncbi:hypothetical protein N7481_007176 [Penicillium waksmanii]|uniref:uncharacterized protein n=1 Tax=Penicillium waksmanii TaxID=69791 RepID=UPI0025469C84|nr:uncharacterized protein N7481_007176 [Penicillium waksmanii]KAJ5979878.1 hypothetical protein N7481_007176 [Penicillium waksmanii]
MTARDSNRAIRPQPADEPRAPERPEANNPKLVKNASSACSACRRRKSRCVGGVPCEPCRKADTKCELDFDTDGRRRVAFKRKIQSLEQDRNLLLQLMETIRSDNTRTAPGVLNLIRSNASVREIRQFFDTEPSSSTADEMPTKVRRKTSTRYMDIKSLSDIPLYEVPAQPWTSVTEDSSFVSHLISLYFTWQHPVLNWMDRDLFLRDMRSKDLNSKFCSPLLVNSILAVGCFYTWYPEGFANPDDPSSRGEHFLREAVRLLGEEEGKLTLTNLQARGDIYTRVATLSLQKPSIIKRPQLEYFPQDHHPADKWTPYPRQADALLAHTNCVKNGTFDLGIIMWEVSDYLFGDEKPASLDATKIEGFYDRLQNWAEGLPKCIDQKSNATPGVMDLHMRYHNAVLIMFGFILPGLDESQSAERERIEGIRTTSAREIGVVLNQFRSLWPVEYMPMNSMQYATMALFALLGGLKHEEEKKSFTDVLTSLRALARRWQLAKGMLRLIQLTAVKQESNLPAEAVVLLRDFEEELWTASDRQRFSSLYPNFAVSTEFKEGIGAAADKAELDRLLEEWDNLTLSSKKAETIEEDSEENDDDGSN